MSNIDWSKAPEGATHWHARDWFCVVDNRTHIFLPDHGRWVNFPFDSVIEKAIPRPAPEKPNKYGRTVKGVSVDVYDILKAWHVTNPALQHLIKKALQCGERGHKSRVEDLDDILASAKRAKELG
ncbi:hypothetical protein X848_gp10 [Edwardsiella phage PEi21]|uniref:Uncharacterized protein n=1 Tax=Edwardsiella phage PEi21 TaxID=1325372 RepID=N0DPB2_9CAUD|nr:hypothetical protein X848_gp10 [Edwardsiella phage PEi21]QXV72950.1 peptidase m15a [Edwardsiella phage PVN06]BAN16820.1 hypothetical protein [Edwardsiella phage PEi21]